MAALSPSGRKGFDRYGGRRLPISTAIMTPSNLTPRPVRGESALAFSIMFFCVALLTFMLGWADGVRHGRNLLHFPEVGGWLIATAVLAGLGVLFLVWSRSAKRG
jgi:hypothetical protein